jgi:hypothetical protein
VYWTNGGPGGSGINAGLLIEMGASFLRKHSSGAPNAPCGVVTAGCERRSEEPNGRMTSLRMGARFHAEGAHDISAEGRVASDVTS